MADANSVTAGLATLGATGWAVTGNTVFNTPGVVGTTTNNNAAAGQVGESTSSTVAAGAAVALTTGVAANVTSLVLTPGDWNVNGSVDHAIGATTSITQLNASISLTSTTLSPQAGGSGLGSDATATFSFAAMVPAANIVQNIPFVRLSIAVTTTIYLVAQDAFTLSTVSAFGTIRARRSR